MKKRTKVVIGIGISLLILVLGGLGFAGNYFYTHWRLTHIVIKALYSEMKRRIPKQHRHRRIPIMK